MFRSEKEFTNQISAFEAMLKTNSEEHVKNACKVYSFDFINEQPSRGSASEQISTESDFPYSWKEEENNVEYYKPTVKLEIKKRISISNFIVAREQSCDGEFLRFSALSQGSIFS